MTIYESLAKVQQALKAPKDQRNSFGNYNYRSCEGILEAVKPLLAKNDLALILTDEMVQVGDRIYVKATAKVMKTTGDEFVSVSAFAREEENKKGMDSSQVTGAASSYARKYALNGLFCIDDNRDSDATNTHGKDESAKEEKPADPIFKCEKCGKPLTTYIGANGKTVSLRAHAEGSKKKFGRILCLDCIKNEG